MRKRSGLKCRRCGGDMRIVEARMPLSSLRLAMPAGERNRKKEVKSIRLCAEGAVQIRGITPESIHARTLCRHSDYKVRS